MIDAVRDRAFLAYERLWTRADDALATWAVELPIGWAYTRYETFTPSWGALVIYRPVPSDDGKTKMVVLAELQPKEWIRRVCLAELEPQKYRQHILDERARVAAANAKIAAAAKRRARPKPRRR